MAGQVQAQQTPAVGLIAPQVLTLDQDRLYDQTLYGQRIQREVDAISTELAELNRKVSAELAVEEQELTDKRSVMSLSEFRTLASAFDEKVTTLREEQDGRIVALQRRRDLERRGFTARVAPILLEIVQNSGAVAILDERAVILSADSIDVTDEAIAEVNRRLGDGRPTAPARPAETPGTEPPISGNGVDQSDEMPSENVPATSDNTGSD